MRRSPTCAVHGYGLLAVTLVLLIAAGARTALAQQRPATASVGSKNFT
jgi:hypothetical protein